MTSSAAMIAALMVSGCDPNAARDPAASDSLTSTSNASTASCLPLVPEVRGSLLGQRELAQREARRLRVTGDAVAHEDERGTVRITPACGSHTFGEEELARGQFVARLTIEGSAPRFSRFPDDTVYWWVYLDLTSGVPTFRSEFLSLKAPSDAERAYVQRGDFVIRCKAESQRPRTEMAGWEEPHEPEACQASDMRMTFLPQRARDSGTSGSGGTSPWFGCKLGCCQSSKHIADEG